VLGDPTTELQPAWNLFRGASRDAYREALGFDDATWARGRGLALFVALPYYKDTNPSMVNYTSNVLREVLADQERER
jgi:aminoglycoside phosphotransferase (APT) family kinase protein